MLLPSVPFGAGVQLKWWSSRRRRPQGAHMRPAGARRRSFCAAAAALLAVAAWAFTARPAPAQSPADYFIDFRSRPGYLFGHTFIVYGRLDAHGQPSAAHLAGIYPIDGQAGLIIGSVIPVRASVRAVQDDFRERPTNIYRRRLSAAEYDRLLRVVGAARRSDHSWDLLFKNCNDFAIEVAKGIGLAAPSSWLMPYYFVGWLRLLNGP
jgi:hypothetical protein